MDELLVGFEASYLVKLLLDEIFHRLHIMIRHRLDVLHALRAMLVETQIDLPQPTEQAVVEAGELRQRQFTEGDEIFDFNSYTIADKGKLREIARQGFRFTPIPAIYRRYGSQQIKIHIIKQAIIDFTKLVIKYHMKSRKSDKKNKNDFKYNLSNRHIKKEITLRESLRGR